MILASEAVILPSLFTSAVFNCVSVADSNFAEIRNASLASEAVIFPSLFKSPICTLGSITGSSVVGGLLDSVVDSDGFTEGFVVVEGFVGVSDEVVDGSVLVSESSESAK